MFAGPPQLARASSQRATVLSDWQHVAAGWTRQRHEGCPARAEVAVRPAAAAATPTPRPCLSGFCPGRSEDDPLSRAFQWYHLPIDLLLPDEGPRDEGRLVGSHDRPVGNGLRLVCQPHMWQQ